MKIWDSRETYDHNRLKLFMVTVLLEHIYVLIIVFALHDYCASITDNYTEGTVLFIRSYGVPNGAEKCHLAQFNDKIRATSTDQYR